jgi:glycosyltransferase involved in cell wall biosynthesis
MNIMWIASKPLPEIMKQIDYKKEIIPTGGWLQGLSANLIKDDEVKFCYCFPYEKELHGKVDNYQYITLPIVRDGLYFTSQNEEYLKKNVEEFKPDIIHLFGTEHSFQTNIIKVINEIGVADRLIVWIQGLVSIYAKHYNAGISDKIIKNRTLKEYIKRNNISDMKKRMINRGDEEIEALKMVKHVFVRTDWDIAAIKAINYQATIHICNESLRKSFYACKGWDISSLPSHRIFMSQSNYPIKGLHMMLEALPVIKREFPDTKIYTTGKDYVHYSGLKDKLRLSTYQKYIIYLLKKYQLEDDLVILGTLNEKEMLEQYEKASVFVSASSIENSPNSLGEAMLVGTPCIVSDVGGVKTMIEHNKEGYIYPFDEPFMLAEYVCRIFRNQNLAVELSHNAKEHARITHDIDKNYQQMKKEYEKIIKSNQEK